MKVPPIGTSEQTPTWKNQSTHADKAKKAGFDQVMKEVVANFDEPAPLVQTGGNSRGPDDPGGPGGFFPLNKLFQEEGNQLEDQLKNLPIQTKNYVLSQERSTYSPEPLANDAWNYISSGKEPNFVNQAEKTEFALKVAEFNLLTRDVGF